MGMNITLFQLGQIVATPGALKALAEHEISPASLIHRHVTGDWSDLCEEDKQQNANGIVHGMRIFSSYQISVNAKIWIITEADRSLTTLLLPDEY